MSVKEEKQMSADAFLAWAGGREGRWEVHHGAAVAMAPDAVEIPNPIVVVDALPPSAAAHHLSLANLILDADRRVAIDHKRSVGEVIKTPMPSNRSLLLDQPGLENPIADLFAA
jgi:hypothetical protein